jgi:hypothetical protein
MTAEQQAWENSVRHNATTGLAYSPNGSNDWAISHSPAQLLNHAFGGALSSGTFMPGTTANDPMNKGFAANASQGPQLGAQQPQWGAQSPINN